MLIDVTAAPTGEDKGGALESLTSSVATVLAIVARASSSAVQEQLLLQLTTACEPRVAMPLAAAVFGAVNVGSPLLSAPNALRALGIGTAGDGGGDGTGQGGPAGASGAEFSRCLGALLNKLPAATEPAVLDRLAAQLVPRAGSASDAAGPCPKARAVALAWATRAVVMRGGPASLWEPLCAQLLADVTARDDAARDPRAMATEGDDRTRVQDAAWEAAEGFGIVLGNDLGVARTHAKHGAHGSALGGGRNASDAAFELPSVARIAPLWRQRFLSRMYTPLLEAFSESERDRGSHHHGADDGAATRPPPLACREAVALALMHLVSSVPPAALVQDRASLHTVLLSSLRSAHARLQTLALSVLSCMLQQDVLGFAGKLSSFVPLILRHACEHALARTRATALGCLLELVELDYVLLHPLKPAVIKGLETPLGDRRRAVRALAVVVRNRWAVISK